MPQIWKPQTFPTCKLHCFCAGRRDELLTRHDNTPCHNTVPGYRNGLQSYRWKGPKLPKPKGFFNLSRHRWHRDIDDIDDIDTCDVVISSIFLVVSSFGILCVILCLEVAGLDPNWALQVWKLSLQKKDTLGLVMLNRKPFQRISYFTNDWDLWSCERASRPGLCKEPSPGLSQRQSQQSPKTSHEIIWDNQMIIYQIIIISNKYNPGISKQQILHYMAISVWWGIMMHSPVTPHGPNVL